MEANSGRKTVTGEEIDMNNLDIDNEVLQYYSVRKDELIESH